MGFVKKAIKTDEVGVSARTPDDPVVARALPALWEYLTATRFEDGSVRVCSTLLIFVEDGLWKACLNDRENDRSAWVSAGTWKELLEALERGLASDTAHWRAKPQGPAKKK